MTDGRREQTSAERNAEFEREVQREVDRREIRREREQKKRAESPDAESPDAESPDGQMRSRPGDETRSRTQTGSGERAASAMHSPEGEQSEQSGGEALQLVARGVIGNSPWNIFLSFKAIIATAFATGAYALIFPTIWELGDSFGWPRLVGLMAASIVAMIFWMILAHGLWERRTDEADRDSRIPASLQNAVTLLTLTLGVLFSYAVLFGLIFLAALVFVSESLLQSTLQHPVSPVDYATLAWVATSISTITGSLGGGLEDEEAVRDAVNFR